MLESKPTSWRRGKEEERIAEDAWGGGGQELGQAAHGI